MATRSESLREPGGRGAEGAEGLEEGGLLKRTWSQFKEDDLPGQAAKVAYYAFLALPPAFMVLFGLAGFFGGQGIADLITTELQSTLPESAAELIDSFVTQVVHQQAPAAFSFGLLLALWGASNVFVGLADALNKAYDIEDDRSWLKRRMVAIGVMLAFMVLFLLGTAAVLAGPQIAGALGLSGGAETVWNLLQWPAALLLVVTAFWIVYYVLPARDQSADASKLWKAAAAAAVLWVVATALFRFYVANFGSYSETYGILGAVIVLLLWLYVTGLVVLTGGELASEMEEGS